MKKLTLLVTIFAVSAHAQKVATNLDSQILSPQMILSFENTDTISRFRSSKPKNLLEISKDSSDRPGIFVPLPMLITN
jgi:hypothetical protein